MKQPRLLLLLAAAIASGCATNSSNMRIGTDTSYISLKDQREALSSITQHESIPAGATVIGKVDASRCHRHALQTVPSVDEVVIDLKIAAYARGADGIANIKTTEASGILQNCWLIFNGEADAFTMKK